MKPTKIFALLGAGLGLLAAAPALAGGGSTPNATVSAPAVTATTSVVSSALSSLPATAPAGGTPTAGTGGATSINVPNLGAAMISFYGGGLGGGGLGGTIGGIPSGQGPVSDAPPPPNGGVDVAFNPGN